MRSNYKKIGLYVQQANQRNKDMLVTNLRGININKEFMPSVANTNGVDLSKYKIVSKYQFAFNPMHVGRDEMLPISMLNSDEPAIVSPAYTVFEIKNHEELDPEYLMMWCRRPEFDRNTWFTTDSSVRGGFSWADFCDMELPVPTIEKQREIVAEYNTIVNRIQLNEKMNQKLEETAQAIYKYWFVDFEFPISAEYATSIGKPELEGKPYKSSGGEMVFCAELDQEIPKGWEIDTLKNLTQTVDNRGKTPPHNKENGFQPLIEIASLKSEGRIISLENCSKFVGEKTYNTWFRSGHPRQKDILFSTVGSLAELKIFWGDKGCIAQNIVAFRFFADMECYAYEYLNFSLEKLLAYEIGSVQASIKVSHLVDFKLLIPSSSILKIFENFAETITDLSYKIALQRNKLRQLNEIILSRVSVT